MYWLSKRKKDIPLYMRTNTKHLDNYGWCAADYWIVHRLTEPPKYLLFKGYAKKKDRDLNFPAMVWI